MGQFLTGNTGLFMFEFEEKTILTIDPAEDIQQGIQTALPDRPCRFVFVDKAEDAVVSLMVEAPNLLIVNIDIPDADGIAMLRNTRAMAPNVPIIILIEIPTKEKVVAAKAAHAIDILLKPPDWERIAQRIKNALWIDPELLHAQQEEPAANGEAPPPSPPEPEAPVFVQAVPKGAEVVNINDTIAGMKIARTLVFNDVIYGDKGLILTDPVIKQLSRIGVAEICVYTNVALKKQVEERKKRALKQQSMVAQQKAPDGSKVFAKIKRQAIRVECDIIGLVVGNDENDQPFEEECNIVDISAGGCALLTKQRPKKDSTIKLSFDLMGLKMKDIRGIVRHSMARNAKPPEFPIRSGIFFDSITERDREALFNKVFQLERDNKKKEDELRARFGYGPKKRRST